MAEMDGHDSNGQADRKRAGLLLLVTGPAGAGRSTALRALEDIGFAIVDRPPLTLLPALADAAADGRPMAIGIDSRTSGFDAARLLELLGGEGVAPPGRAVELLYLDCAPEVLARRFAETRRPHPLDPSGGRVGPAIDEERALLHPLAEAAGMRIDTTTLTPHELRRLLQRRYGRSGPRRPLVTLQSFSFRRGIPPGAELVFDCRFLRNPHWEPALRERDGREAPVRDHVAADARFGPFVAHVEGILTLMLEAAETDGRHAISAAFGCTGGRHRSVSVAEEVAERLAAAGVRVETEHRELASAEEDMKGGKGRLG